MRFIKISNNNVAVFGSPVCNDEELPPINFDFCQPDVRTSEIRRLFLSRTGAQPFNDWTLPAEWTLRIDETAMGPDAMRELTVIGDKPTPTSVVKRISLDRKKVVLKTHTVLATIDDVSDANHAFVEFIGPGKYFKMWYESTGRHMYGGNNGIVCLVQMDMVLPRGQGEIATYNVICTWDSLRTEDRCESPIFDDVAISVCSPVTSVTLSDVDEDSITAEWESAGVGVIFQFILTTSPTPPVSGYTTSTNTDPVTFGSLLGGTTYYFHIRVICADGGTSEFVTESATTDDSIPVLPITDDLVLFCVGSYGVQTDMAGKVTQWDDLSAAGNHLLPVGVASLTVTPDIGSGEAAVLFDGSQMLRTVGDFVGLTATSQFTAFIVMRQPSSGTNQPILQYAATNDSVITNGFGVYNQAGLVFFIRVRGDVGPTNKSIFTSYDTTHVYSMTVDKSLGDPEVNLLMDKIITAVPSSGYDNSNVNFGNYKLAVGGFPGGTPTPYLLGAIGAIVIYNVALSPAEVDTVNDYLMTKYGI